MAEKIDENKDKPLEYKCELCNTIFPIRKSLYNHRKKCKDGIAMNNLIDANKKLIENISKLKDDHVTEIKRLNDEHMTEIKKLNDAHKVEIKELTDQYIKSLSNDKVVLMENSKQHESDKKHLQKGNDKLAKIALTSASTSNFLAMHYPNPPVLMAIKDVSNIKGSYKTDTKFAQKVVSDYRGGRLDKFLADYLTKEYKKDDPREQAAWSSDASRVNWVYSISILIHKNKSELEKNNSEWASDKGGDNISRLIINPALKYVKNIMNNYSDYCKKMISTDNLSTFDRELYLEHIKLSAHILKVIDEGTLNTAILKIISKTFYLDKKVVLNYPQIEDITDVKEDTKTLLINHKKDEDNKDKNKEDNNKEDDENEDNDNDNEDYDNEKDEDDDNDDDNEDIDESNDHGDDKKDIDEGSFWYGEKEATSISTSSKNPNPSTSSKSSNLSTSSKNPNPSTSSKSSNLSTSSKNPNSSTSSKTINLSTSSKSPNPSNTSISSKPTNTSTSSKPTNTSTSSKPTNHNTSNEPVDPKSKKIIIEVKKKKIKSSKPLNSQKVVIIPRPDTVKKSALRKGPIILDKLHPDYDSENELIPEVPPRAYNTDTDDSTF